MIGILVSTYNGDKYIEEQLDSILNQSYKEYSVFIRDDGSSDNTVNILEKYCTNHDNFSFFIGQNIGYSKSFLELLSKVPQCDYYAFCDQDDFWESYKLEYFIEKVKIGINNPILYYSNYYICDNQLNVLSDGEINTSPSLNNIILQCPSNGMTMVINHKMREVVIDKIPDTTYGHDWWISLVAISLGEIVIDERQTVKWRRNDNSLTGKEYRGIPKQLLRLKKVFDGERFQKTQKQIVDFNRIYGESIDSDKMNILNLFTYDSDIKFKYLKKLMCKKKYSFRKLDEILFRFCIFFRLI